MKKIDTTKILDLVDLQTLSESALETTKKTVLNENRNSKDLEKASDVFVSAFERWLRYAKTGDWELKSAQYVLGNAQYVVDEIRKLVK